MLELTDYNKIVFSNNSNRQEHSIIVMRGLGGVVGLTLPMAGADRGSRPVYYLPCSDLGQVVNISLSVAVNSTPVKPA